MKSGFLVAALVACSLVHATAPKLPAAPAATAPAKHVIGKLGQSTAKTAIYRKPSRKSTVLSRVDPYRYLVVNPTDEERWLAVVMSDGSTGFIDAETIAQLPYEVTSNASKATASTASLPSATIAAPNSAKQSAIQESFRYIGTPYKWGGEDMTNGVDCSSFVQQLYGGVGIKLPRTAHEQARVGQKITRLEQLQPGDRLYFWSNKRGDIGHTGLFLGFFQDGGAYFIHSSSSNHGVATDDLRNPKWRRILVDARRD